MRQTIGQSTATFPLGYPTGQRLFRVQSGQYAGREVVIYQAAPGEINCTWADRPYAVWSTPITLTAQAADLPFDAAMAPDGTIHLVYTEAATGCLATRRLVFNGGTWLPFAPVTITDQPSARCPSVVILPDNTLWVCWDWIDAGLHRLFVKSSGDNGVTWGTGPSDPGESLTPGASAVFGKLAVGPTDLHAVFTNGAMQLTLRSRPLQDGTWGSSYHLASGENFDEHFDVAVAPDGRIGVVWDNLALRYREFDGDDWAPTVLLHSDGGSFPQLIFVNTAPLIAYLANRGADQMTPMYTVRQGGVFTPPAALDNRAAPFTSAVLYDTVSATYSDLTAEAASATAADIAHPVSNALLHRAGDALYLGMDERFRYVKLLLSSVGAGGSVVYSSWDGSSWAAFTPASGVYHFDTLDHDLLLWDDYNSIPVDWQKKLIAGASRFWVRIEALADFAAPPTGSQITAISELTALMLRR